MPHEEHDPTPLPDRLAGLLAAATRPKTVLQIAGELRARSNTVSKMLIYMVDHGTVKRAGAGRRGDPYMYSDVDAISIAPVVDITPDDVETGPPTRPVPPDLCEADTLAPVESGFLTDAYDMVVDDLLVRADAAIAESKILVAAATLLKRIADGEADRC